MLTKAQTDAHQVIRECFSRGVLLRTEGGRVRWKAANGTMDTMLLRRIKAAEAELLAILPGQSSGHQTASSGARAEA